MSGLAGKTAIVTGAGSGIGRAIAHRLAAETALVGVLDINAAAAEETVAEILSNGGRAVAVACDIGDADAVDVVADAAGVGEALLHRAFRPFFGGILRLHRNGLYDGDDRQQRTTGEPERNRHGCSPWDQRWLVGQRKVT